MLYFLRKLFGYEEGSQMAAWMLVAAYGTIPVLIWELFFPSVIPFRFLDVWRVKFVLADAYYAGRPIFIWGLAIQSALSLTTRNHPKVNQLKNKVLKDGFKKSLRAGVFEELVFRWLWFYWAIVLVKISNSLFFNWGILGIDFGIAKWSYNAIAEPFVRLYMGSLMDMFLYHPEGWAVGAAMLATNVKFRDGHKYQGLLGWVNSWVLGLLFFRIAFLHGLLAAILVHFVYDVLVHTVVWLDVRIENALGIERHLTPEEKLAEAVTEALMSRYHRRIDRR